MRLSALAASLLRPPSLLLAFTLAIAAKVALVGWSIGGPASLTFWPLAAVLAFAATVVAIAALPRAPARLLTLLVADGAVTALVLADQIHLRAFADVLPMGALLHASQVAAVRTGVAPLFRPSDAVYFLDFALIAAAWILARGGQPASSQASPEPLAIVEVPAARARPSWPFGRRLAATLVVVLLASGVMKHTIDRVWVQRLEGAWDRKLLALEVGTTTYHLLDLERVLADRFAPPPPDDEVAAIARWLREKNAGPRPAHFGRAAGRDVIVVQVEALQSFVIGRRVAGGEITPVLNALAREACYFPNVFAQVGLGNTSDAEFMAATSLYPSAEGAAFVRYARNTYDALPAALGARGYHTAVFHANVPEFWNRYTMYPVLGFKKFHHSGDFRHVQRIGLGLGDEPFYEQALAKIAAAPRPAFNVLVSLSSHLPFNDTAHYGPFDVGALEGQMLGDYFKSLHYADRALGTLIARLKAEGRWDDTLFVVYGDHPGLLGVYRNELRTWLAAPGPDDLAWVREQRVPFFVRVPGAGPALHGERPISAAQIDLMPTLAGLLGVPTGAAFGQDLLAAREGFAALRDGTFVRGDAYYDTTGRGRRLADGVPVGQATPEDHARVRRHIGFSGAIVKHDLLPRLRALSGAAGGPGSTR